MITINWRSWKIAFALSLLLHVCFIFIIVHSPTLGASPSQKEYTDVEVELSEPKPIEKPPEEIIPQPQQYEAVKPQPQSAAGYTSPHKTAFAAPTAVLSTGIPMTVPITAGQKAIPVFNGGNGGANGYNPQSDQKKPSPERTIINTRPSLAYKPPFQYPTEARRKGLEGSVQIKILINENGVVEKATLAGSSGSSMLDQAAIDWVFSWRFKPAYKDNKPAAVSYIQPVSMKLH